MRVEKKKRETILVPHGMGLERLMQLFCFLLLRHEELMVFCFLLFLLLVVTIELKINGCGHETIEYGAT